jgi:hypothetical protein
MDAISMQVSHSRVRNSVSVKRMPKKEWLGYQGPIVVVVVTKDVNQHLGTTMFPVVKACFVLIIKNPE